jgi:pyruvate/2-oxoglutarate dehydrogenase complex dihydrolipoamide dehydrogenase (E3) component
MGGDCLNTGCVPSKALIRSAKIYQYMKRSVEFGFEGSIPNVNFAAVMARVAKTVKSVEPHDSVERYESLGVKCFQGDGKIISPYEVEVNGQILTTKNIVIATGARPIIPPIEGLKDVKYLTSDNLWKLSELPKNLVVLGGGPIGCELAQSFARLGSNVTIVELAERLLQKEDKDVSQLISARFREEDIEIKTAHRAVRVDSKRKTLICDHDGHEVAIAFDEILLALGRQANVTGFGLEELGVELSQRQSIATDEFLRTTNYPNIYACGDVCGPYQFTHTASHQAWFVAVNALFSPFKKFPVDYRVIPWATFCDPEVARVGLNEAEALSQGIAYAVTRYELSDLDRAIADGETEGFVKILTPPNSDRILGVTIVGHRAGDTIAEYILAMKQGLGLNKILGTIHIYPTLSEANKMAAGVWKKQTAPQKLLALASRYHSLRRGR